MKCFLLRLKSYSLSPKGRSFTFGLKVPKRVCPACQSRSNELILRPIKAPFTGGLWKIHVELPDQYPYKSPSIGFVNRIFHPNIDELSGSVCLDVINQTWSPMFDMINIFEVFLPQLLRYPNPTDPLNGEAAALLMRDSKTYEAKVKGQKLRKPLIEMAPCLHEEYKSTWRNMQLKTRQMKLAMIPNRKTR